jgi:iron complex transport system substrate-binding protein
MEIDDITGAIVDATYKIHVGMGPGLLELVHEAVPAKSLERKGFRVERQNTIRFDYDGMSFDEGFNRIVNNLPTSASPRLRVNQCP